MAGLTNGQKKEYAKTLYLSEKGITQKEIAVRVGATEATISKWATTERWEDVKTSLLSTKEDQLAWLYSQLSELRTSVDNREVGKKFVTSKDADVIAKLTTSIKKLETETNISQKVEVGKQFLVWLRQFDAAQAIKFLPLYDAFIKESMR